jgi:hypothetical protein
MITSTASTILQVGGIVLLALGSGLVLHVLRLAESEAEAAAPQHPSPASVTPLEHPPLRKAA